MNWFWKKREAKRPIYDYVPAYPFVGLIRIEIPNFAERMQLFSKLAVHDKESGQFFVNMETFFSSAPMLCEKVRHFELRLGKRNFKNLNEILDFEYGFKIFSDLMTVVCMGIPLTKPKEAPVIKLVK